MRPPLPPGNFRLDCRVIDPVVFAFEGNVFFGPKPAGEPHEFFCPAVSIFLIALRIAVGRYIILAGNDVQPNPATGKMIKRGDGRG